VNPPFSPAAGNDNAFAVLRQFARKRRAGEVCELCSSGIATEHQHLIEPAVRKLVCVCEACAILFSSQTSSRFRRVPRRIRFLPGFQISDTQWEGLMIPIELAFFFKNESSGTVSAFYPGPAGAIESLLALDTWTDIEDENPVLRELQPEVEALIANRVGATRGAAPQYYIVPIDECYKLVGLIRLHWHGLSGGTEVWREVGNFFASLKERTETVPEESNA
jgi:Family of unknown function (DUF5947)